MKIFTGTQIAELDKYTIEHEPIASLDLMERAARAITGEITKEFKQDTHITVFAGSGNNGGDALAVARMLAERGYDVEAFLFNVMGHISDECKANRDRLTATSKLKNFVEVTTNFEPPKLEEGTVVIDGLFGSGLSKPLSGGFASLVRYINQSPATVVSIDMPSGLLTEDNSDNSRQNIIRADITLTIQQKKLAMLLADTQRFFGEIKVIDIGLSREFIETAETRFSTIEEKYVVSILPKRDDFANKGSMGTAVIIAGSYGMAGASVLTTKACLRSGVGKAIAVIPGNNYNIMQTAVPEAVVRIDNDNMCFTEAVNVEKADALAIGPGLGCSEETAIALLTQIRRAQCPIVADADALNILGSHRAWMQQLPEGIILTPHPREFERLAGTSFSDDYERLAEASDMATKYSIFIILKGHFSALCLPDGHVLFNTTGNSGMATAGSGDVLTGIITALLARGCNQQDACAAAMYIHGLAGDIAAEALGKESMTAGDIIRFLPEAFKRLNKK